MRLTAGTLTWRFVPSDGSAPVVLTTRLANINDQFSYRLMVPCERQIATLTASANTLKLVTPPISYDRSQVTLDATPVSFAPPNLGNFTFSRSERGRIERIDLEVSLPSLDLGASRPSVDMDGNGLSDVWEIRHFGKIGINPNADSDRDGMSHVQEMKAGTDPNEVQSAFAFIEIAPVPQGGLQVRWSSVAGKTYALQRSPEMLTGYVDIRTGIPATPPVNSFIDDTAVSARTYFYRLRIQE